MFDLVFSLYSSFSILVLLVVFWALYQYGPLQRPDSSSYPLLRTAPPLTGRNMLTRGTSAVIDIHNTSTARPLQIEYPAVLKKTMCFWGAKYNPSPSPLGPRNGSEGGKTGGLRVGWGVMGLPGFHIREVWGGVDGFVASQRPISHEAGTERTKPFAQLLLLLKL